MQAGGVTVRNSSMEGLGVFATVAFAPGDCILTIDDSHVVDAEHPVPGGDDRYCDFLEGGKTVCMQTPERHINHSCDPNVYTLTEDGIRRLFSLRAITPGQEIAYDYSINGSGDTTWVCNCGSPRCRRTVHSDFFHLPFSLQREYLPLLDTWFRKERARELESLLER